MEWFWSTYIFAAGLVLGSFYNVVGLRLAAGESIVSPRSACPECGRTLSPAQLIPVLSYVWQRGRCAGCGTRISPLYPAMELVTGMLFFYAYWALGFSAELVTALLFISLLVICTVSDLYKKLILNNVLLFFLVPLLLLRLTTAPLSPWWDALIGSAAGFLLLLFIAWASRGGMGGGDIKLYGVIGLVLGTVPTLLSLFLAALCGLLFAAFGIVKNGWNRKTEVPFGPFIALGALLSYFFAEDLLTGYWMLIALFLS
ncbi:prepilin peptidase [Alkalicoccus urumqiensis]|uniref:Prepilin peptidase n=1 Tax=Alkalicoccus urumqiensis TaxID=1548213 RepID=A0A2P6MF78_ALKUR|nr:A24 family peptidase [Alkalicoccus urumqiensis]PRO64900.1 prepilin peptidase [Alkalicoccus urumqiensis]